MRGHNIVVISTIWALLVLCPTAAWATGVSTPPGATSESLPALPEVVVSASLEPTEAQKLPATVQVITAKQIVATGATTLDQALVRLTPGNGYVQPGAMSSVGLRGFRSNQNAGTTIGDRVLVLIDGHRAGTSNPAVIPLANVERIEIVRGPASVVYGGSAMGGVVNLITKRGKGKARGSVGASYGTFSRGTGSAAVSGGLDNDRYGYAVAVQGFTGGDYAAADGKTFNNTHSDNVAASGSVTFRPEKDSSLSLVGAHQSLLNTGSPGYYPKGLTPDDTVRNSYNYLALEFEKGRPEDITFKGSLFASQNLYSFHDAQFKGGDTHYLAQNIGGRGVLGLPLGLLGRLALGAEYSHMEDTSYGDSVWQPNSGYDVLGLFAEHRFDVGSLSINYGLRYDSYGTHLHSTDMLKVKTDSTTYDQLSWSAGATWWLLDWLGVRISGGSAFVPPTARTLAGNFRTSGLWATEYRGNPDLKPEKSVSGEAGLEIEYENLRASVAYFHSHYTDRVIESFRDSYFTYRNNGDQLLSGLDISLNWKHELLLGLPKPLVLTPYFTGEFYTQRQSMDNSPVLSVPEYSMVLGLGLGYGPVQLDVNARITGPQEQNSTVPPYRPMQMEAFDTYNARLTVTPVETFSIYVDMENITNRYYNWTQGYPMPGRAITVGFRYEF